MFKFILLFPVFLLCSSPAQAVLNESSKPKQLTVFLEQNLPYSGFDSHLDSQGLFVDYWSAWSTATDIEVKFVPYQNQDVEQLLLKNKPAVYSAIDAPLNLSGALKNASFIELNSTFYYLANNQQKITTSLIEKQSSIFVGGLLPEASQLPLFVNMPNIVYKEYPGLFEILLDIYLKKIDALVLFTGEQKSPTLIERFLALILNQTSLSPDTNELQVYTSLEQAELLEWVGWGLQLELMKEQASTAITNTSLPIWGISSELLRNLLIFFTISSVLFIFIRSNRVKDNQFKDLVDYSPNPIVIFSLDANKIFHINDYVDTLIPVQGKGKGYCFKNPESQALIAQVIKQQSHQTMLENVLIELSHEGKRLDIEISARRIHYKRQSAWLCYLKDVTAWHYAERKLAENRELLDKILDSIPEQISFKSTQGKILGCNESWAQVHNSSVISATGRVENEFLSTEQYSKQTEQEVSVWRGETNKAQEWVERQNKWCLLNISKYPLYNKDREVFAILTIDSDITDLYNLKKALDSEKAQRQQVQVQSDNQSAFLTNVIKASKDAIAVLDHEGLIIAANASFAQLIERGNTDIVGLQIRELSTSPSSGWLIRDNQQAFVSEQVLSFQQGMFIDGQNKCYEINKTPFYIPNNEQQHLVIMAQQVKNNAAVKEHNPSAAIDLVAEVLVDKLTGIANRRAFEIEFLKLWQEAIKEEELLSIVKCDIDFFSAYNLSYGQQHGDIVLTKMAAVLSENSEQLGCFVARYLGAGFVILMKGGNATKALKMTEKIHQAITDMKIKNAEASGKDFLTVSMGLSSLFPSDLTSQKMLLAEVNSALDVAKTYGGDQIGVH
jgi:diguanylate cyclase (GGDEF)-like protein